MSSRKRFFYNMNTCIGCGSCQVACKDSHHLLADEYFRRAGMRSMRIGGEQRLVPFSISCNHCEHPACVAACPTGAMRITVDGLVLHDDGPCIGCGRCYWACPYGEVSLSKTSGYAQKCDTCLALREKGLAYGKPAFWRISPWERRASGSSVSTRSGAHRTFVADTQSGCVEKGE